MQNCSKNASAHAAHVEPKPDKSSGGAMSRAAAHQDRRPERIPLLMANSSNKVILVERIPWRPLTVGIAATL